MKHGLDNISLEVINEIISNSGYEIDELRPEVFEDKYCGRSWERALQKYDELLIRKHQTKQILNAIIERMT